MKKIILLSSFIFAFAFTKATNFNINIVGFSYSPNNLTIQVGDQVTIQASLMHPAVQTSLADWNANNPNQLPGGFLSSVTFVFTATAAGIVYFGCENHMPTNAMKASITITAVAPVLLSQFIVKKIPGALELEWTTETEINASHFEIERSYDGSSFINIGNIAAHGNSSIRNIYSFKDATTLKSINYYRLKAVDVDRDFTYSKVVRVVSNNKTPILNISPNPVKNIFTISTDSGDESIVYIFTSAGKKVKQVTFINNMQLNAIDWQSGVYIVKTKINNQVISKTFLVSH